MVWQNKLFYFAFVQNWRVSSVTPVESYFCHFKLHHSKLCARKKLLLPNKSSSGLVWTHTYGGRMPGVLLSCSVFLCGMLVMVGKKDPFYVLSGLFFPLAVVAAEGQNGQVSWKPVKQSQWTQSGEAIIDTWELISWPIRKIYLGISSFQ